MLVIIMYHRNIISVTGCSSDKLFNEPSFMENEIFKNTQAFFEYWKKELSKAEKKLPACEMYSGRGFRLVNERCSSLDLYVVSAGLGLVKASNDIPTYQLTISKGSSVSIQNFIDEDFDATSWWTHLKELNVDIQTFLDLAKNCDFVLMSLSEQYLKMIINDIAWLSNKIIVFSGDKPVSRKIKLLGGQVPYTEKFDGPQCPISGTKIDFAQRCHADFLDRLKKLGSVEKVLTSIKKDMDEWDAPVKLNNKPLSDKEIRLLIKEYKPRFSSIGAMLKFFRHDRKVACEEKRFASLYRSVSEGVL